MREPTVGMEVSFSKTISESDVYGFAGISGDFSPNHVDHEYMSTTRYQQRIAHGVLTMALMSTCSTKLIDSLGNPPTESRATGCASWAPCSSATHSPPATPSPRSRTTATAPWPR